MSDRQPTEFGWWLLQQMAAQQPPLSQAALARATRVSDSTVSRWIYTEGRPDADKLADLARVLGVDRGELLHMTGYGRPHEPTQRHQPDDPLLAKLALLLADPSPVPPDDLVTLRTVLTGVIAPYERHLNRPRRIS